MKLVYIAGPYRGNVEKNVAVAQAVGDRLAQAGVAFICPHSNGYPHEGLNLQQDYWLESTLEICSRCDATLVVGNFKESEGTWGEIKKSFELEHEIFYDVQMCIDWALK